MNRVIQGFGERIELKVPEDIEVFGALQAERNGLDEMRALVKGALVSPALSDLEKKSPACVRPLARMIAGLYGMSEPSQVVELAEDEIDEASAAVIVEKEKEGSTGLYVLRFDPAPALKEPSLTFVMRPSRSSRDLEEINRNPHGTTGAQAVVKRLCVQGPVEELDSKYPGVYGTLSLVILTKAGVSEELVVGEA